MDGYVATFSCWMAQSVRFGFLLNDELDKSGSRIKHSHVCCAELASLKREEWKSDLSSVGERCWTLTEGQNRPWFETAVGM